MLERSCGTVPFTVSDGVFYYLLIRTGNHGLVSFPKGHIEEGETERETALRETWEETSLRPVIAEGFRYEYSYPLPNGNEKRVVFFAADFGDAAPAHNEGFEEFDFLILPFAEAYDALSMDNSKEMLRAVNEFLLGRAGQV